MLLSIFKFISKLLIMTNFTSFNNYLIKNNINLFDYQNVNLFYKCSNKQFIIDRSKMNECNVLFLNNNYKSIN